MSVYLRGGIYWAYLYIHGKRVRRSLGTTDKRSAEDAAKALEQRLKDSYDPGGPRLDAFIERYMTWAWDSKPASAKMDEYRIAKVKEWFAGQGVTYMAQITPVQIESYKAKLQADGQSKATINRYLQLIRGLINRAIDWEAFEGKNPVRKVKLFREDAQVRPLTSEELGKVLGAAKAISADPKSPIQKIFYAFCVFAINTGMRKSEILHLKWADVRDGEAFIRGKGDKARRVPLNAAALAVVNKQPHRSEWVFHVPNRDQHDALRRTVDMARMKSGVPHFHVHLFRHWFTSAALGAGVDIVTVGNILGHSKTMVSLLYSHTSRERARAAVDNLPSVSATAPRTVQPNNRKRV